jgi:hypothetical protein
MAFAFGNITGRKSPGRPSRDVSADCYNFPLELDHYLISKSSVLIRLAGSETNVPREGIRSRGPQPQSGDRYVAQRVSAGKTVPEQIKPRSGDTESRQCVDAAVSRLRPWRGMA